MKRFDFKLQKTMEWRQSCADREKAELEKLHQSRNQFADPRQSAQTERETLSLQAGSQTTTTAEQLHQLALFSRSLLNLEQRLEVEEAGYSQKIQEQQDKCIRADRDHRLLTHLRDNQLKGWKYELDRESEQVATDSWNSRRIRDTSREPAE